MCACFMLFTETQATNRKSEGENITILTWQFEQSSNWQYLDFLMILYSTIFILEAFCKLKWITHIHLSCVCCLKEHFLFLFNRQYIRAKKKKRKLDAAKRQDCEQQYFGKNFLVSPCKRKLLLPWEQQGYSPITSWQCLDIKYSLCT